MFAGSMGDLRNKVFRIGHMGVQCNMKQLSDALDILEEVLKTGKK